MTEDKIVVKKTAARPAVIKKTAARRRAESIPADPAPTAKRKTRAAKTGAKDAPLPVRAPQSIATGAQESGQQDDQRALLRQLALASEEQRLAMIREAAYYKAEKRQFTPGHELEDWTEAEREIDELIARARLMLGL